MTSIVELFPKCRKLAYDARQQLAMLQQQQQQQQQQQPPNHDHPLSPSDVRMILTELTNQLSYMEGTLLPKEIPQQRMIWSRKIQELQQEAQLLFQQCNYIPLPNPTMTTTMTSTNSNYQYQSNRDELLNLRQRRQQKSNHHSTESDLHHLSKESSSIQNSTLMIHDILQSGELSYQELKLQRKRMNTMTSLLSSMSDTIGLSKMTIQIIERRDITDLYYAIGGMIITLIVLYVTWFM